VKRIPSLDGLRAASIITVAFGHMAVNGHAPEIFKHVVFTGVQIFFVISGYLITSILLREYEHTSNINLRKFYIRRAYRIFPAALVFILVTVCIFWRDMRWYHILAALFYLSNYDLARPWVFGQLWSLGVEEQFYLIWPSVLKRWYKHRMAILVSAMGLAPASQMVFYFFKLHGNFTFFARADNLAIGCILAIVAPRIPRINKLWAVGMLVTLYGLGLFAGDTIPKTLVLFFVLRPILYVSMAGLVLHVVQTPYRILNWAPVVWLGRISYSLYLWQQPFCGDPNLRSGYYVFLALGAAVLSYYLVEQPMLRLREKRKGHRQESSVVILEPSSTAA
jgi:peptidoglycan/LPS O-acetylase OafA/YrhL